jgi:hypothetical protein
MLVPGMHRKLVDEQHSKVEPFGVDDSLCGHRPVRIEDGFEVLVEILDGETLCNM